MTDLAGRPIGRSHRAAPEDGTLRESDARTGFPWVNAWADRRRTRRAERAAEAHDRHGLSDVHAAQGGDDLSAAVDHRLRAAVSRSIGCS